MISLIPVHISIITPLSCNSLTHINENNKNNVTISHLRFPNGKRITSSPSSQKFLNFLHIVIKLNISTSDLAISDGN